MANFSEGKKTTFDSSLVERLAAGLTAFRSMAGKFFTPAPAMKPVSQQSAGRRFDYAPGFNMNARPRGEEGSAGGIDFQTLRNFADNYDLLRLVIETRKDQLCKMKWNIVSRDAKKKVEDDDPRVQAIRTFFMFPDRKLAWDEWLRMLIEDMLVIDAATIYPRMTYGGQLYSLDVTDGATIKLLINDDGRTPDPPDPAYQQVIKGMAMADYTTEELVYKPRNLRSWKVYGYSPVEQVMMTVNIALRRQLSQLHYFTEGNIPEAWATCPPEWTPDNIREIQEIWDNEIEGKPQLKRKVKFMPGGVGIEQTREATIKDQYDEWLARLICFAFSISPQALIQMMNRATAETASEQAMSEGLAPLMQWVKNLIDYIIVKYFDEDGLEFQWEDGKELDPKTASEIHMNYIECGVLDADEVRQDIGRDSRASKVNAPGSSASQPLGSGGDQSAVPSSGTGTQAVAAAGEPGAPQVGPDGKPVPQELGPDGLPIAPAGAGGGGATVQDTAMNGTQISSLLAIVTDVATKNIPAATAKAVIFAAFPAIKSDLVDAMLAGLENFEPPAPPVPVIGVDGKPAPPPAPGEKKPAATGKEPAAKGDKKSDKPASDDEEPEPALAKAKPTKGRVMKDANKKLSVSIAAALATLRTSVLAQVTHLRPDANAMDKAKKPNIPGELDLSALQDLLEDLELSVSVVSSASAVAALDQLKSSVEDMQNALNLANSRAEEYAKARAGELIGSDANGGELADSTRELIRNTILKAEEEGWSNAQLRSELEDNYAFSKQRADTIARTELKSADSQGALEGWKASGLKMKKEWILGATEACEICEGNSEDGPIDLDDSFSSGDDTAPAHPNCDCSVQPVIDEEELS